MGPESPTLSFGPYRLVGPQGPLWHDTQEVKLPPKALAVLWLLACQAGEVVTKTALLDAVWPKTVVGEDALAFQIQLLRHTLRDEAKQPRYIATLHRLGYYFVAPVTTAVQPEVSGQDSEFREKQSGPPPHLETENKKLETPAPPLPTGNRPLLSLVGKPN